MLLSLRITPSHPPLLRLLTPHSISHHLRHRSTQRTMPLIASNPKPRVILGLMTFGPNAEAGARVTDPAEYAKVLDYFQSQGYNEVDTARSYINGAQEAFTRDAKWQERGLTLATKHYPHAPGEHKPEKLRAACELSLKELGADTVDIYYLHAADRSVPFEETLREANKMFKEGKFVRLGLSNYTSYEVAEIVMTCKANGWVRPTIYQGMYNAITRNIEPELFYACRRYGLDIVIYNPIAGGLFSGKYDLSKIPESGRFSDAAASGSNYRRRYFRDANFDALRVIEPVVQKHNLTLIETALRWTMHHSLLKVKDGNDGIIIGVSSLEQLKQNLEFLEKGPLPDEVVKALDEGWLIAKPTSVPYWHGDNTKYTYDTVKALFG